MTEVRLKPFHKGMTTYQVALAVPVIVLGLVSGCAHAPLATETNSSQPALVEQIEKRKPANLRPTSLPDQDRWQALYDYADALDLSSPSVSLKISGGGTSVYAVIQENGRATGAILPENESTSVSGEIFAWTLSRALGVSELFQPSVYRPLSGPSLQAFLTVVPTSPMDKKPREANRLAILKRTRKNPNGLPAVYKSWDLKPADYDAIEGAQKINELHVLPGSSNTISSMLQCNGPRPSAYTRVSFNGGSNTEFEIARELSSIALIDALTQQYDRYTGGNIQTVNRGGRVTFVAYDNGGTWGGTGWTKKNLAMITRFDSGVANQILAMDDFFRSRIPYLGLRSEREFATAFDFAQSPKDLSNFKQSLKLVAEHIRRYQGCWFY